MSEDGDRVAVEAERLAQLLAEAAHRGGDARTVAPEDGGDERDRGGPGADTPTWTAHGDDGALLSELLGAAASAARGGWQVLGAALARVLETQESGPGASRGEAGRPGPMGARPRRPAGSVPAYRRPPRRVVPVVDVREQDGLA